MSTMLTEVYDAFRAAGVPDEQARAVATVLTFRGRRYRMESTLSPYEVRVTPMDH